MKTVMDAVSEFKGVWPYVNDYVCVPAEENDVAESGEFQSAKSKYTNEMWVNVCNKSEFNTLVQGLMTNFGRSSFKHLAIWQAELKESKENKVDYTSEEFWKDAPEGKNYLITYKSGIVAQVYNYFSAKPEIVDGYYRIAGESVGYGASSWEVFERPKTQPLFTKAMQEAGEEIKQGMLFECSNGEKAELLLPIDESGMGVAIFNGEYVIMCQSGMKPIGTKESREKTIADISPYCIVKPEKLIDAIKAGEINGVTWSGNNE